MIRILLTLVAIFSTISMQAQCWQKIATGNSANHSNSITTTGRLYSWGENTDGKLGDNSTTDKNIPTLIGAATDWKIIAPGGNFTLALKTNGELWGWGNGAGGQLGDGTNLNYLIPTRIGTQNNWDTISAGFGFGHAIKTDGTLWAWGSGGYNQLGTGGIYHSAPTQVGSSADWKSVSGGVFSAVALKTNGTIWQWGNGYYIGAPSSVPVQIGSDNDWRVVVHGAEHNLALKNNGTLWAWGNNLTGQLGNGTNNNTHTGLPVQIGSNNDWAFISAAGASSFAIKTNGTLWAWGNNSYGQLGTGSNTDILVPTQIGTETNWNKVAGGAYHTLALKNDGTLWSTGLNSSGQLGLANNSNGNVFSLVSCGSVLPVRFGYINASIENHQLIVNWQTLQEIENSHFDIEVSRDGRMFKKAGTVISQAQDGNSSTSIEYRFQLELQNISLVGLSLFPFLLAFSFPVKNRRKYSLLLLTFFCVANVGLLSCSKEENTISKNERETLFVRVKQVDKDGQAEFSKIIKVNY